MHLRNSLTICFLLLAGFSFGQDKLERRLLKDIEVFGGIGTTSYFGDVGGKDSRIIGMQAIFDNYDIDLWQVRGMATAGVRVFPFKSVGLSLQLSPVFLSGNDLRSNYASRGYSFRTWVWEGSFQGEFFIADRITGFAPYGLAGISGMLYAFRNNLSNDRSKWYAGNSLIFGFGTRLPTKTRYTQSIDAAFHFTATDFIDGFKTEKNSNDIFFILSYKINFQIYSSWYYDHRGLVR
jgi:hypothetical protein